MIDFKPIIPLLVIIIIAVFAIALFIWVLIHEKYQRHAVVRRFSIIFLMLLILLRPVFLDGADSLETNDLNIFFAVDATNSMSAKDIDEGKVMRYEKVRSDIAMIADALPGSQYSITLLSNAVFTTMPLSDNRDLLNSSLLTILPPPQNTGRGTSLEDLLAEAQEHIESYARKNRDMSNILFVFSDGEDTSNKTIEINSRLKNEINGGAIFGYGTNEGAIMTDVNHYVYIGHKGGQNNYGQECIKYYGNDVKKDKNNCAISSIHETSLKQIASSLGLNYYHRESGDVPNGVIEEIKSNIKHKNSTTAKSFTDIYWIFALIIIALLLWEFSDSFYKVLLERTRE